MNMTRAEIKEIIMQLPIEEINQLIDDIQETIETKELMKLAETGFQEWNDPEEDIYNNET
ncbi:hypothetical protein [Cyanothece sp. BG0011]|uniref:hypothetical protein n=1 Tax=Cyanothece sp. BG0011 TaxID=2082950 RepID=UPI000D1D8780